MRRRLWIMQPVFRLPSTPSEAGFVSAVNSYPNWAGWTQSISCQVLVVIGMLGIVTGSLALTVYEAPSILAHIICDD